MKVVRKRRTVFDAIQWDGENTDEVVKWLGDHEADNVVFTDEETIWSTRHDGVHFQQQRAAAIRFQHDDRNGDGWARSTLRVGDWVLYSIDNESFDTLSDNLFQMWYEEQA